MKVNYYEVLGVDRSASEPEIRERFRKLGQMPFTPDKKRKLPLDLGFHLLELRLAEPTKHFRARWTLCGIKAQ